MTFSGVGVHSGADAFVRVGPAPPGAGSTFHRTDLGQSITASADRVAATTLATVLSQDGAEVRTVEHLMSAMAALSIRDATIEINTAEVPIMDGSAKPFFEPLSAAVADDAPADAYTVKQPVWVSRGEAYAAFIPAPRRQFDLTIDFADEAIGIERLIFDLDADDYGTQIAPARTFGRYRDIHKMRRKGFARGASLDNAVAVDGAEVLNPEGLRFPDEFVRHKLLDAIGDLALAGKPIIGLFRSHKGGHRLNYDLLRTFLSNTAAWELTHAS